MICKMKTLLFYPDNPDLQKALNHKKKPLAYKQTHRAF